MTPQSPSPLQQAQYREALVRDDPRYADPTRLCRFGYKVYSQHDEDGLLAEIFHRIGVTSRRFVEIGVDEGLECNTLHLLLQGWSGQWVEAHQESVRYINDHFETFLATQLGVTQAFVTAENANEVVAAASGGDSLDLLCIDVDGNDYWIWESITSVQPRVVAIEYNATWRPPLSITMQYDPAFRWDGTNCFGASLCALTELGARKGYSLVGCSFSGVNAFFVRHDLVVDRFAAPFTAENHYEPPRYWMIGPAGHMPGIGRIAAIGPQPVSLSVSTPSCCK